ncbi:hypothetical protein HDU92_001274 [Lobulomyces angularis]|nr:hypothetical protein HDU92_001274 [Lobulomyces angularis]
MHEYKNNSVQLEKKQNFLKDYQREVSIRLQEKEDLKLRLQSVFEELKSLEKLEEDLNLKNYLKEEEETKMMLEKKSEVLIKEVNDIREEHGLIKLSSLNEQLTESCNKLLQDYREKRKSEFDFEDNYKVGGGTSSQKTSSKSSPHLKKKKIS